jgi:hypothetical protein
MMRSRFVIYGSMEHELEGTKARLLRRQFCPPASQLLNGQSAVAETPNLT